MAHLRVGVGVGVRRRKGTNEQGNGGEAPGGAEGDDRMVDPPPVTIS